MNILDAQIENGRMVLGDQRTVETDTLYGLVNCKRPVEALFVH